MNALSLITRGLLSSGKKIINNIFYFPFDINIDYNEKSIEVNVSQPSLLCEMTTINEEILLERPIEIESKIQPIDLTVEVC